MKGDIQMQIMIDIPEEHYRTLQEAMKNHMESLVGKIILNGTPIPDNATNGDVIKTLFPNLEIEYTDIDEYTNKPRYVKLIIGNTIITRMSSDRWNAPYQKGGKVE